MAELDPDWLRRWRDDVTEVVGAVLTGFQERIGYPPGDNVIGPPMAVARIDGVEESLSLPADLATFARVVGDVSLPDIDNGWFVLGPLYGARIGPPYEVDIVQFASDGGGTVYALPTGDARPVFRLREVPEVAPGVYDGERVEVSAPHLRAFLEGVRAAISRYAHAHGVGV